MLRSPFLTYCPQSNRSTKASRCASCHLARKYSVAISVAGARLSVSRGVPLAHVVSNRSIVGRFARTVVVGAGRYRAHGDVPRSYFEQQGLLGHYEDTLGVWGVVVSESEPSLTHDHEVHPSRRPRRLCLASVSRRPEQARLEAFL